MQAAVARVQILETETADISRKYANKRAPGPNPKQELSTKLREEDGAKEEGKTQKAASKVSRGKQEECKVPVAGCAGAAQLAARRYIRFAELTLHEYCPLTAVA